MSETKETDGKAIPGARKTMTLGMKRTVEQGHVRQSFSHGRSKSVLVEKKRKRPVAGSAEGGEARAPTSEELQQQARQRAEGPRPPRPQQGQPRKVGGRQAAGSNHARAQRPQLKQLSSEELDARTRALTEARKRAVEEEARRRREEAERLAREQEAKRVAEEEARRAAEEEARRKVEEEARQKAEIEARKQEALVKAKPAEEGRAAAPAPAPVSGAVRARPQPQGARPAARAAGRPEAGGRPHAGGREAAKEGVKRRGERTAQPAAAVEAKPRRPQGEEESERPRVRVEAVKKAKPEPSRSTPKTADERRARSKLTITNALVEGQRERSLASLRRQRERLKKQALGQEPRKKIAREVQLPEAITIQELSNRMAERAVDLIKFLMKQGQMHKINDVIDADTAELLAHEFGHTVKRVSEADVEEGFIGETDAEESLKPRAPVVTIMGHVDHGKTSLLDALRHTNVVSGEAGGITQHIGAYQIVTEKGAPITFIDTPGHAAFTAMRARGAKVTDIVVLVVAADDGVMPQTVEAINHAKAANVPLIVAINKIDKPDADPQRVRTELLQHSVVVESMSGDTLEVEVSAKKRTNLDKLLEAIHLQSEILELRANPDRAAEGVVIEAKLERGRGPVGTVLIERGTLRVGQIVVAGRAWGRVRALINDKGAHVVDAGPAVPVEVLGFNSAPEAGDQFAVVESEARAREITEYRVRKVRDLKAIGAGPRGSLEQMMSQLGRAGKKEFPLIIKGDVQGSVEAITAALDKLGTEEVAARIIHAGVGGITESDISLASTAGAAIVGFNVRANSQARVTAEQEGIEIRYYNVIYNLVDDIKSAMSGLLAPAYREDFLGNAEILEVFNISKVGKVAGCRVTEGRVERGASVRLIRDNVVIHEGKLGTLKRFKDEVKEVVVGQECGMAFEKYEDLKAGDVIECYHVQQVQRTL
jgi:translation initiation factor IF-2